MADQDYRRSNSSGEPLRDATVAWFQSLPAEVRPVNLSRQFPRITNRLCELWKRPARCEPYFTDLLFDRRGTRRGFPPEIKKELYALDAYYGRLHRIA